jgi:hypothetical protein
MNSTCLFILVFAFWTVFRFHCIIWTNPKWGRLCVCFKEIERERERECISSPISISLFFLEIWIKFEFHEYFSHTHIYTNHHFIWNAPWAYARASELLVTQVAIWYTKQYTKYTCALTVSNNFDWNVNCVCVQCKGRSVWHFINNICIY